MLTLDAIETHHVREERHRMRLLCVVTDVLRTGSVMGEARVRLDRLRQTFIEGAERWMFDRSAWEDAAVAEILALPVEIAHRPNPAMLRRLGLPERDCHTNAERYAAARANPLVRPVLGWWRQPNVLLLHSVVEMDDRLVCVTPSDVDPSPAFSFVRDPRLVWDEDENDRFCRRDGRRIGPGLRIDPTQVMADTALILARLRSGMNPYEAVKVTIGSGVLPEEEDAPHR
jgi:hypothetical protein